MLWKHANIGSIQLTVCPIDIWPFFFCSHFGIIFVYFLQTWKTLPFVAVGLAREENNYIVVPGGIVVYIVVPA